MKSDYDIEVQFFLLRGNFNYNIIEPQNNHGGIKVVVPQRGAV